jgi:hypothetical protein
MIEYVPKIFDNPIVLNITSAWGNLTTIIKDILEQFKIERDIALEFGTERGYSAAALANYFTKVIGVDPFNWDVGVGISEKFSFYETLKIIRQYNNIQLVPDIFENFIQHTIFDKYDLIHIDIGYETHTYDVTYPCGEWSVQHSDCVLFHDTVSFPEINRVCIELSNKYGFDYYNYPLDNGLGILIKRK